MQITRDLLNAKKADAIMKRDKHLAGANACEGAIAEVDQLLHVLDIPEPPAKPATPAPANPATP